MKALTLYQPWASLIAQGTKVYETRSWPPPERLIGQRIAIHAGKSEVGRTFAERFGLKWDDLPRGVVCTARLVAAHCIAIPPERMRTESAVAGTESLESEADPAFIKASSSFPADEYGDYATGRWAWRLVDVELLDPPVPARGRQGLWNWEPDA